MNAPAGMAAQSRAKNEARFPALKDIKTHPALDAAVPLMTDAEFKRITWDIGKHGLLMPIVRADDVVIDGRCRYIACKLAGVEPRFKPFDGKLAGYDDEEIEEYIFRVNFMRQSLTPAQVCMLDAIAEAHSPGYYPEGWVSDEARLIVRHDDIARRVTHGGLSLAEAYNEAIERDRAIAQAEEHHRRLVQLRAEAPFAAALVDEGSLTLDQALARVEEIAAGPLLAEHVQAIKTLGRRMVEDTLDIGRRLSECRRLVRHDWAGWLHRELGLSDRAALNFMRVYELAAARSENFSDLDLPVSGLYLLAAPSTPESVRDDVFRRAALGEAISFADIKREVSGERPADDRLSGLAKAAAQLGEERPDDPLVHELAALVARIERRADGDGAP
jgi:hypothetical protein